MASVKLTVRWAVSVLTLLPIVIALVVTIRSEFLRSNMAYVISMTLRLTVQVFVWC